MGTYVVLTAYLFQRGSSESKPIDEPAPQDEDPRDHADDPDAPVAGAARRLGARRCTRTVSPICSSCSSSAPGCCTPPGGAGAYSDEELAHGGEPRSTAWST